VSSTGGHAVSTTRISVIVPVKDHAVELCRVLADLAAQTRPADQVVVVDNGPDDEVVAIARAAGATVIREAEPGVAAAAAAGYDAATGDIIARCDADSRLPRGWLASVDAAMRDRRIAAVSGPGYFYDPPARLTPWRSVLSALYMGLYRWTMTGALAHPPLFGSNCAFRRSAWLLVRDEVHRTGTHIHDDVDLSVHLGAHALRMRWEPAIGVGIASAPLRRGAGLRTSRGWAALALHWPAEQPTLRWRRRIRWGSSQRVRIARRAQDRRVG
jgi:glycosyltransferase involved in cell wall biosynthesis